jgi:arylsulfatase A-like enzyme
VLSAPLTLNVEKNRFWMKKKNVLLIVCHDLGQHLNCYGNKSVHSPHLDRMAREGVLFENNFCTSPGCSPSRAAIMTGRFPHSNGVFGLSHADFLWRFNEGEKHIAQILSENGYQTAVTGHWHENDRIDNVGYQQSVIERNGSLVVVDEPPRGMCNLFAPDVSKRACFYLNRKAAEDKPFFLYVGFFEPHRPFDFKGAGPDREHGVDIPGYIPQTTAAEKAAADEEFAALQGSIRVMDQAVGQVMAKIEELGMKDDTLVLFTCDHGLAMPRAKCSLYDPGIETPLILWGGGSQWVRRAGARHECLVSNVDYVPTILDALDISVPENVQGRSLFPLLSGGDYQEADEIFAEKTYHRNYDPIRCIRTKTHKYIINFELNTLYDAPSDIMQGAIYRTSVGKYMDLRPRYELYDLQNDPWERNNLAENPDCAALRKELHSRLVVWMKETGDALLEGPVKSVYYDKIMETL